MKPRVGAERVFVDTNVLVYVFEPQIPLPHAVAAGFARQLLAAHIITPSADLVVAAMERTGASPLTIWEALILAAAESCGARCCTPRTSICWQ